MIPFHFESCQSAITLFDVVYFLLWIGAPKIYVANEKTNNMQIIRYKSLKTAIFMDYNPQIWPFLRITTCKNPINLNTCDKNRLTCLTTCKPFNCIYLSTWMFSLHHPTQMTVSAEDDGVSLYSEVSGFFCSAFFDEECLLRKIFLKKFIRPMRIVFSC